MWLSESRRHSDGSAVPGALQRLLSSATIYAQTAFRITIHYSSAYDALVEPETHIPV